MKLLTLALLSCAVSVCAFAQSSTHASTPDSTSAEKRVLQFPGFLDRTPTLIIPPSFDPDIVYRDQLFLIPELNGGGPPPLIQMTGFSRSDMMLPWRLHLEREARLRPLYTILATVQIGGVAYLAYEHLRKNGLFK